MSEVKQEIIDNLREIVKDLTGQDIAPNFEHSKDERYGDYTTNIAMAIFVKSEFKSSLELAEKIADRFRLKSLDLKVLERIEVVRPGFINFWLSKEYLVGLVELISKEKENYGKSKKLANKKIMLEFADPNPFKEFHIGHLRNISLGESYARLLESQGGNVWRVNYQGDVGMHVAKALWGIMKHESRLPKPGTGGQAGIKKVESKSLDEKVKFLGEAYSAGAKAYEENDKAKKEIQLINIKIYRNDTSTRDIWKKGREWSLEYFEMIYKRVGTLYKRYYFESEVAQAGRKLVLDNIDNGIFEKSDGAIIFRGEKYGLHNRVFVTKEDYATYEAKDMALAPIKYKDFPYDKSIIITAHEQAPYFKVVLSAMKRVSPDLAKKTVHDSFGFVSLRDKKMSSRLGNVVTGEWLLNEAKSRIKSEFKDMENKTGEMVAVGAVKYSMLKLSKELDISFSFDDSISLDGNSGPYLQYAYARTQSVLTKAPESHSEDQVRRISKEILRYAQDDKLIEPEELSILRSLYRFPDIVGEAAENFAPNIICNYLFDLAQKFNLFYQKHKILESEEKSFRLGLTGVVGQTLKNGLNLLGMRAPERM